MKNVLYWMRNDLRIHDNVIFKSKLSHTDRLIPIYVFESKINETHIVGFERTGIFRKKFLLESLIDLKNKLQGFGSNLYVFIGKAEDIIPEIVQRNKVDIVYATKEHTQEETDLERRVQNNLCNIPLKLFEQLTLIHPDHIPVKIESFPDVFTDFRKMAEKKIKIRAPFSIPLEIPSLPENLEISENLNIDSINSIEIKKDVRSSFKFKGGETEGLKRMTDYIWNRKLIMNYKQTRNNLIGEDYSSKFSAWLAVGALSPRIVFHEIQKFERSVRKNISTYWLFFELLWRDFFRFTAMKNGNRIFMKSGIKKKSPSYANDFRLFEKWKNGETGNEFIDANMKELNTTGFMSNRGRQNVASYLVHDLSIDWRWGASYFESKLIDYDVCSNWCNWMYFAGVGNDPVQNRRFNISRQAEMYDPEYSFRDLWLSPETKLN